MMHLYINITPTMYHSQQCMGLKYLKKKKEKKNLIPTNTTIHLYIFFFLHFQKKRPSDIHANSQKYISSWKIFLPMYIFYSIFEAYVLQFAHKQENSVIQFQKDHALSQKLSLMLLQTVLCRQSSIISIAQEEKKSMVQVFPKDIHDRKSTDDVR